MKESKVYWGGFKRLLLETFEPIDKQRTLRVSLRQLRQTGKFSKFVEKFLTISDKITEMPDEELKYIFLEAIDPEI